jgi:hypothetical protein
MKIVVVKKSPKREKEDREKMRKENEAKRYGSQKLPGIANRGAAGKGGRGGGSKKMDPNMFFLSKKEKNIFNQIDTSPVEPTKLITQEQPIEDWAVR